MFLARVSARRLLQFVPLAFLLVGLTPGTGVSSFNEVSTARGVVVNNNGLDQEDWGFGCAFNDFDNDGDLDLYVATEAGVPNKLFCQGADGNFIDIAAAAGVDDMGSGRAVKFADFDNDGHDDFFLGNHEGPNRLYRNNGDGTFTDVADSAIAAGNLTFGACWADYDNDGYVDLYVVNRRRGGAVPGLNQLFHNQGDGTFVNRAAELGVDDERAGLEAVWFDYDNDRDQDLYLSNDRFGGNRLWRNDGGTFVDVSVASGTNATINSMGVDIGDYDGDGDLDLYITNSNEFGSIYNVLYRNHGDGTFDNAATELGVRAGRWGWGCAFFDHDNDGDLDLYVVNASARSTTVEGRNQFFRNNSFGAFTEVGAIEGIDEQNEGFGVCTGDFDGDGRLDIFLSNNKAPSKLFRNTGPAGRWLKVRLEGVASNRSGIGARIRVTENSYTQIREVNGGSSYLSQHSLDAHFGVGNRDTMDVVEVLWPSGCIDRFERVATNQTLTVVEGCAEVEPDPDPVPSPFSLGQNYPNPFNPGTRIAFELTEAGPVKLTVHDVAGRTVQTLVDAPLDAGPHVCEWDGRRGDGALLPSGVYFYRLVTEQGVLMRKMVHVK